MFRSRTSIGVMCACISFVAGVALSTGCDNGDGGGDDTPDAVDTTDSSSDADTTETDGSSDATADGDAADMSEDGTDGDGSDGDGGDADDQPVCGNGTQEGDEACDDGNDVPGDGCENDCTLTIDTNSQNIVQIEPPSDLSEGAVENTPNAKIFVEHADYATGADVYFNSHVPRDIRNHERKRGTIPPTQHVNSYLIHSDPEGQPDDAQILFQVAFSSEIIAITTASRELDESDEAMGLDSVNYPTGVSNRGLESVDAVVMSPNRKRLTLTLTGSSGFDQIRVFTRAPSTPEQAIFSGAMKGVSGSVVPGETESSMFTRFEKETTTQLTADLAVDIDTPGTYDSPSDVMSGTIPSGTSVSSYIVHFDPDGTNLENHYSAITFANEIVGVNVESESIDDTNFQFAAPGISYPANGAETTRGLELQNDTLLFGADKRSLWMQTEAQNGADQIRVFVAE